MKKLYFRIIPTMSILFKTRLASTLATQGRRKGGAEGANAPSIFGKLQSHKSNESNFKRILRNLQQLLFFENSLHHQF